MNDAILDGDIAIKGDKDAQRLQTEQLKFSIITVTPILNLQF